jgi:hypothetical protein
MVEMHEISMRVLWGAEVSSEECAERAKVWQVLLGMEVNYFNGKIGDKKHKSVPRIVGEDRTNEVGRRAVELKLCR